MSGLTPTQLQAAELIAIGQPKKAVAEGLGITPQTVSGWSKLPRFQAYLNQLKRAAQEGAHNHMRSLSEKAVGTVEELMGQEVSPSIRLRAAQVVLNCIGMGDPKSELWRIGPTDEKQIETSQTLEKKIHALGDQLAILP